ncbi:helix-turn-helix transcriptional regulator [Candidatus Nomurabacteria bacterium]|nr:helix-turn-helix transcriptional regulator [Candidatus Nomurabacteria bacterium]
MKILLQITIEDNKRVLIEVVDPSQEGAVVIAVPMKKDQNALTRRERRVVGLLAEGMLVREVAKSLNLSVKTAEAHLSNAHRKLDIHNRAQLVQYAVQHHLIEFEPVPDVVLAD